MPLLLLSLHDLANKLQIIRVEQLEVFADRIHLLPSNCKFALAAHHAKFLVINRAIKRLVNKTLAVIESKDHHHQNPQVIHESQIVGLACHRETDPSVVNKARLASLCLSLLLAQHAHVHEKLAESHMV